LGRTPTDNGAISAQDSSSSKLISLSPNHRNPDNRRNKNAKKSYPAASGSGADSDRQIPGSRHDLVSGRICFSRADPAHLSEDHVADLKEEVAMLKKKLTAVLTLDAQPMINAMIIRT
jgi:hypothetical protein